VLCDCVGGNDDDAHTRSPKIRQQRERTLAITSPTCFARLVPKMEVTERMNYVAK